MKWVPPKREEFVWPAFGSDECKCEVKDPVRYRQTNNVITVRMQCRACKRLHGAIPKNSQSNLEMLPLLDGDCLRKWEDEQRLAGRHKHEARLALQQEHEEAQSRRWWEWYNLYLRSPEWRQRRAKVMDRAGNICEACRERPAAHAHHLNYAHVGNEPLFDLVAICQQCHDEIHSK
jgi:hypothetical protein